MTQMLKKLNIDFLQKYSVLEYAFTAPHLLACLPSCYTLMRCYISTCLGSITSVGEPHNQLLSPYLIPTLTTIRSLLILLKRLLMWYSNHFHSPNICCETWGNRKARHGSSLPCLCNILHMTSLGPENQSSLPQRSPRTYVSREAGQEAVVSLLEHHLL